ncbi:actin-1 [Striga asiatica]|uniref:Actin-1 n=1 Tax=Striga asiatica TaxID=4170 RepID=A0A5A7RKC5_STRAF|nr:actin-1 [Striga asiatica]
MGRFWSATGPFAQNNRHNLPYIDMKSQNQQRSTIFFITRNLEFRFLPINEKLRGSTYLPWQDSYFFDYIIRPELGPDLQIKKPGEKEGPTQVIHKLLYLIALYGNEALVAAVLAIFRLEDDTWNTAQIPLFGGYVLAGESAWDRVDGFVVLRVRPGQSLQVGEQNGVVRFLEERGGGEAPEMVIDGGGGQ